MIRGPYASKKITISAEGRKSMKSTVVLAMIALFVGLPQIAQGTPSSSGTCSGASRTASKAAQDYRDVVGKVDAACNSSAEDCQQERLQANQTLDIAIAANEAVLAICTFTGGKGDDALPVTAETVTAAIDLLPETVLIPCRVFDLGTLSVSAGCPDGWLLNVRETNLTVSTATATSFNYGFNLHVAASIPINAPPVSCTLTATSPLAGIPVTGTASFLTSSVAGPLNRLQLTFAPISNLQIDGCGVLSSVADLLISIPSSPLQNLLSTRQLCGATGPEL